MADPGSGGGVATLPGSASVLLRDAFAGPDRAARVLGVFPAAIYLADSADGAVVAVCTHDAIRLPNAVVVAARTDRSPFPAFAGGGEARIGAGGLTVGGLRVDPVRWWTPPHPPAVSDDADVRRAGRDALRAALRGVAGGLSSSARVELAELARHAADFDRAGAAGLRPSVRADPARSGADGLDRAGATALRLIGLGPGLTPSGDDALCGFLLALRHLDPGPNGARRAAALGERIAAYAPGRTTDLSAALLGHAGRGHGCPQLVDLIGAVGRNTDVLPCLRRLLTVGHTSGADLAIGVLAGADAAEHPYPASASANCPHPNQLYPIPPYPEGRSAREQRA
ncbi:DUF2877 domain-containing protein [Embleya sp. AB8]|uniref:DUF2877 domain-containing protein n=1 Tax=Embleya sp. AB8 TaxID=3156304 RepID=UPI003C77F499